MFHQSVEGLEKYPPMAPLTPLENYRFCDPNLYKLLTLLMIADSKSYTVLQPEISSDARMEFNKLLQSIKVTREILKKA